MKTSHASKNLESAIQLGANSMPRCGFPGGPIFLCGCGVVQPYEEDPIPLDLGRKKKERDMFRAMWRIQSGLTVPELLVVLAGMMMVVALTLEPLNNMVEFYRLDSATQSLVAALELGRHRAVATSRDTIAAFYPSDQYYLVFQDDNSNRVRDPGEILLSSNRLPEGVVFDGAGLLGPPSSPTEMVADPISFSSHCAIFNPQGKLAGGTGTIYLRNKRGEARAISYNISGRLKVYSWQKRDNTWK